MIALFTRRLGSSLVSILILTVLVFGISELTPGGPAYTILGIHATAESVKAVNASLGLDKPIYQQYATWLLHMAQGNLGFSPVLNQSVSSVIAQFLGNTLVLDSVSLILAIVLSIAIGMLQGAFAGTIISKVISFLQFALYAMPLFWLGLILITIFCVQYNLLPSSGSQSITDTSFNLGDYVRHLILPMTTLTLSFTALFSRYMGAAARLEYRQAYVTVASAKGAAPMRIALRHVLRNALRPLITVIGLFLPWIFAGGLVVEEVFNFPGLGYLLWQSALQHDYPVLMVIVLMIGTFTIIGNLLADVINGLLDTRVRYA
jgi:peptide/nickel transport system permease protein